MFNFPWTNFHELNLDWILSVVKEAKAVFDNGRSDIDYAVSTADEAKEIATQAAEATIPDNSISTTKLQDGAVTNAKLANNSVTTANIVDRSIIGNDIAENTIESYNIKNGTIIGADIADSTIQTNNMVNGSITNNKLADRAVTAIKIALSTILLENLNSEVYEIGTWTPTQSSGSYSGTLTFSNAVYIKIGKFMFASCLFSADTAQSGGTYTTISGLPYNYPGSANLDSLGVTYNFGAATISPARATYANVLAYFNNITANTNGGLFVIGILA